MIERTPEFTKAEHAAFWPCMIPFSILCGIVPWLFAYFGYQQSTAAMRIIGAAVCFLIINPLILKSRIKEFPHLYWRFYYAAYGSLFGVFALIGVAVYWVSVS